MDLEKLAVLEAVAATAKKQAEEAGGADEGLNQALSEAEAAVTSAKKELEAGKQDIDFKKELKVLEELKPPKRSEKEKAKYTVDKIYERFPDLREDTSEEPENVLEQKLLRNQVEGIIRASSQSEDEIKYKLWFYDNRVVKTGNIHNDADDAIWLANKERTRNAIREMERKPMNQHSSSGPGQKPRTDSAPDLPVEEVQKLVKMGLRKVAPDRWEGVRTGLQYNKQTKSWEQFMIKTTPKK